MNLRRKLSWIGVLYFAEGFPFGIFLDNLPVYFRTHGVSLTQIGWMNFLRAPWALKVLWSPLVDRFGTRQRWIIACQMAMAVALAVVPLFDATQPTLGLWIVLMMLTTASATQDIAVDAYT